MTNESEIQNALKRAEDAEKRGRLTMSGRSAESAMKLLQGADYLDNEGINKNLDSAWDRFYELDKERNIKYVIQSVNIAWRQIVEKQCSGYINPETEEIDLIAVRELFRSIWAGPMDEGEANLRMIVHRCARKKLLLESNNELDLENIISAEEVAELPLTYNY